MRDQLALLVLFSLAVGYLWLLWTSFPELSSHERELLAFSRLRTLGALDITKDVAGVLSRYTEQHYFTVLQGLVALYVVLQAFSIPGTIFLTVALGSLFGVYVGFVASMFGAVLGASGCFLLSYLFGRRLVARLFPGLLAEFGRRIRQRRQEHQLNYLLFLRATPIVPNWFINLACPVFDIPYRYFVIATAIGIIPAVFTFVQAGVTLHQLSSAADLSRTWQSIALMFAMGFLCLLPTFQPVQNALDRLLNRTPSPVDNTKQD